MIVGTEDLEQNVSDRFKLRDGPTVVSETQELVHKIKINNLRDKTK